MQIASRNGVKLKDEPVRFNQTQKIYDFDVEDSSKGIYRIAFATFSSRKNDFPLSGNIYLGESTKNRFDAKNYQELVSILK